MKLEKQACYSLFINKDERANIMITQTAIQILDNNELKAAVSRLRKNEHKVLLEILLHLVEVENRKLYLEWGYGSMFAYLQKGLQYSEGAASRRLRTARCVRDYPEVFPFLVRGEVTLSTLSQVQGILDRDNYQEILEGIRHKSQKEVEVFVSQYRPREKDIPERVRPMTVEKKSLAAALNIAPQAKSLNEKSSKPVEELARETKNTEQRYELRFSVSEELMESLDQVKALLSGKYPLGARLEDVMAELVGEYLEKHDPAKRQERREKRKAKKLEQAIAPRKKVTRSSNKRTRYIPAAIRDEVLRRDNYQCSYVGENHCRCGSKWDLEIDHIKPWALGGENTADNLRTLCAAHNRMLGKQVFG